MTPSKWLQDNLVDVLVAVAQAQAALAGSVPVPVSQQASVDNADV